jgi:hypothetical protein
MTDQEFVDYLESSPNSEWYKILTSGDGKYLGAMKYIIENKPKFTLEYGGGRSTYVLTLLINELNYGGKIIGIEEVKEWWDHHNEDGSNEFNNIILVGDSIIEDDKFTYVHDLESYKDVDFVILDGPDYRAYGDRLGVTLNLKLLVDYIGKEIPYFIDGRQGCVKYYKKLGYTSEIPDIKNDGLILSPI